MPRVVVAFAARDAYDLLLAHVAEVCGVPLDSVRIAKSCFRCGSAEHGQPFVVPSPLLPSPPAVSASRTDNVVLVAVSNAGPVGVDVELLEAAAFDGFDGVALHPLEVVGTASEMTRTWVRKESLLKATGHGLSIDPREVRLSAPDQSPEVLVVPVALESPVWMWDLDLPPGYVGAVTVLSAARPELLQLGSAGV